MLRDLSAKLDAISGYTKQLDEEYPFTYAIKDFASKADHLVSVVIPLMDKLRKEVDEAEKIMPRDYWPYPCYDELLFSED